MGKALKLPKAKCCVSKQRCDRCPIRMLKDGTLPSGYGVQKRRLVRLDADGRTATTAKVKKSELADAVRKQRKASRKKAA